MFLTDETKKIIERTMQNLSAGNNISDEDLRVTLKIIPDVVKILEPINRRQYDLVTHDIRQDVYRLEDFLKNRKIDNV